MTSQPAVHGDPPLTGRLEPWMSDLLADPDACRDLLDTHGSPVNVLNAEPLSRRAVELVGVAAQAGVDLRLFLARKANKALSFVDAAHAAGHGVDVASEAELRQVLGRGVPGERIILTAAVKPDALLRLAVDHGATISLDSPDEATRVSDLAVAANRPARVAPRLMPDAAHRLPPTRFGAPAGQWLTLPEMAGVEIVGVHFHLHGYAAADRAAVLGDALGLVDELRRHGARPGFIDIGGGMPMSYLDDRGEWDSFWQRYRSASGEQVTWKGRELRTVYPFHQATVQAPWLADLLGTPLPGRGNVAQALAESGLRLHLEPGRALLDGCGLTLARVSFVKRRSDGVGLVGLEMNRTQCRSTSDDFLVDPLLLRSGAPGEGFDGFLVGAYCIEDEVLLLRRMTFPQGVTAGDVVVLVNTAGYLMHILESASHQIPLARNVVRTPTGFALDPIDEPAATLYKP